jgi:hypothetical protein
LIKLVLLRRVIVLLACFSIFAPVSLHAEPVRISSSAISWLMTPVRLQLRVLSELRSK